MERLTRDGDGHPDARDIRVSALAALAAMLAGGGGTTPAAPRLASGDFVHFDGNSITTGFLASSLSVLMLEWAAGQGLTITTSHTGINGQTWDAMASGRADVAAAYDAYTGTGRRWLIVGETINSINVAGQTSSQAMASAKRAIALLRADRPWDQVIGWESTPCGHGDETTYPGEHARNLAMMAVDADMRAQPTEYGLDRFIDIRSAIPMYSHDGSLAASFAAYQAAWHEDPAGSTTWPTSGWVHPKDGTYSPPTGKRAIAQAIGQALTL